jgi:hypothetical protein
MSWKTAPKTYFLKAGQANQLSVTFDDKWIGPQYIQAVADLYLDYYGPTRILLVQWQGVATEVVFDQPTKIYYVCGVQNATTSDVWFHLEGGTIS